MVEQDIAARFPEPKRPGRPSSCRDEGEESRVVVLGGGPAGLLAAGRAASLGAPVLLLERTGRLGTKLRLSGGGRCNVTNTAPIDLFLAHFGPSQFLRNALARFSPADLVDLLEGQSVPVHAEQGGRVFPASGSAHQVAEALAGYARRHGVQIRLHSRGSRLLLDGARIRGILLEDGQEVSACAVVVATGGTSYPKTGSTGDGYRLAAGAGHTIVPVHPALVPLLVAGPEPEALQGLSLRGVVVRLLLDQHEVARATGDVLFAHFGLSGPAILALSGAAVERMGIGSLEVSVNLLPADTPDRLRAALLAARQPAGKGSTQNWLRQIAPPRMARVILRRAGIDPAAPVNQVTSAELSRLCGHLQDLRFSISGHRSWDEAMLTAGGVDTREVDPRTMESRLVAGLYFAGEVLDLQADTGGFNLQAAFSTGYAAGTAAAHASLPGRPGWGEGQGPSQPEAAQVEAPHGN